MPPPAPSLLAKLSLIVQLVMLTVPLVVFAIPAPPPRLGALPIEIVKPEKATDLSSSH